MDLKLKITQKEESNMSILLKQMCALKCRIKVDVLEGEVSVEGIDDNDVENVIDSICEAFNIVGIDIIPTVETLISEEPVVTAESLEFAKIEFSNKQVEEQVNKLMRVIYWAMYSNKATTRDICQHLMSAGTEIAMKYNPTEVVSFSIGDIVVCNYGNHLSGEISGSHVHAIVCDIDEEGVFYALPITKAKMEKNIKKYLPFEANLDVDYLASKYNGGTVLLKKGGYIRPERIQYVVGKARPKFFEKLLEILPNTVSFSHGDYAQKYGDMANDDSKLLDDIDEIIGVVTSDQVEVETPVDETSVNVVTETPEKVISVDNENDGKSSNTTKKISAEEYVTELLKSSIEKLDKTKPIQEQIETFLDDIGFKSNEKIIRQSFMAACEVKKVGYESILLQLHNVSPNVREEIIKSIMREEFNKWLALYPELKEKYPKISFMVLLKVFAKRMR